MTKWSKQLLKKVEVCYKAIFFNIFLLLSIHIVTFAQNIYSEITDLMKEKTKDKSHLDS